MFYYLGDDGAMNDNSVWEIGWWYGYLFPFKMTYVKNEIHYVCTETAIVDFGSITNDCLSL